MKINIHRGLREIGGNIIEISSNKTRLIVDAGVELDGYDNPVDFQGLIDSGTIDAIIISHYHADHVELLSYAENLPPIYFGKYAFSIYQKAKAYRKEILTFTPVGWLENQRSFFIGDIRVTPILADHSALDSYSLLFECEEKKVLYTGDFRGNGRKSFSRYLNVLPTKVDALICEGTTLGRSDKRNMTEMDLENIIFQTVKKCHNQVFILLSAMNMDRIVSAYRAAKKTGRILLQDVYTSLLTGECIDLHIPNPITFSDVYAFTVESLSKETHAQIRKEFKRKFVGKKFIAQRSFIMCVRSSYKMLKYIQKLNEEKALNDSILIYSMWDGYKTQTSTQHFIEEMKKIGVDCISAHSSGHADAEDIRCVVRRTNPTTIFPIHTENETWFITEFFGVSNLCIKKECEV